MPSIGPSLGLYEQRDYLVTWQIVGHDWAVELLSRGLAAKRLAHAYLFSGAPHIGKTRLALALAQAVNCPRPEPPCGQCPSCRRIDQGSHPDVHLIEGAGAGGGFKIEQIRALPVEDVSKREPELELDQLVDTEAFEETGQVVDLTETVGMREFVPTAPSYVQ